MKFEVGQVWEARGFTTILKFVVVERVDYVRSGVVIRFVYIDDGRLTILDQKQYLDQTHSLFTDGE